MPMSLFDLAVKVPAFHPHSATSKRHACMVPGFFAESEHEIVRCFQHAAVQETVAIPGGPTWVIIVPHLPEKRPPTKTLSMLNCKINRVYCFEAVLSKRHKAGLEIRNWIFSDAAAFDKLAAGVGGVEKGLFPKPFMAATSS